MVVSEDCPVILEARDIVKVYPDGVRALDGVSLRLYSGMVHAVLGENGAGKTTLMRILYGEIRPTRGQLFVCGRPVRFRGTVDAIRNGIAMVYQHPRMVPTLTVWENMALYFNSAHVPLSEARSNLEKAEEMTGFHVPLDERVEDLPLGAVQRAEILRSLAAGARVLILDEPTTNLTPLEVEGLFRAIKRMKEEGIAIAYITHRLPEVKEIAEKVTVLRRGKMVASELDPSRVTLNELARLMVGELPAEAARKAVEAKGQPILELEGIRARGRLELVVDRLVVREGEILGVAGVEGNGQEELVGVIVGLLKPEAGRVRVLGAEGPLPTNRFLTGGGAFVPGDRKKALLTGFTVAENLAFLVYTHSGPLLLTPGRLASLYERIASEYKVKAESPWTPVESLSGGNQQKLLVGSQLFLRPKLLVAVNPTRGLDVATTRYVRNLIAGLAGEGAGVLLVSSDLDEIMELSDRIAVIHRGRITGVLDRAEATPERLGVLMGGGA